MDNEIRKKAWMVLLNVHEPVKVRDLKPEDETTTPKFITFDKDQGWNKHDKLYDHKMADQIEKDVNRSLNHFNLSFFQGAYKKQLSKIMTALFDRNRSWSYYQGFNDVCSVCLVALSENLGFHASLSLSHYYMRDYLRSTFEKGVIPALNLMMKIIQGTNPHVYEKISFLEMPTFAVSWIITWFAHDLEDPNDMYRIYDYCIASHPATVIYMAAATVIYNKDMLLEMEEDDMATVHMIFQKLGSENFELEDILKITHKLMKEYPVDSLLYDNRKIGFEADSPILNTELQIDQKLAIVSEATNKEYIFFEIKPWDRYKTYLSYANVAAVAIICSATYLMYRHAAH